MEVFIFFRRRFRGGKRGVEGKILDFSGVFYIRKIFITESAWRDAINLESRSPVAESIVCYFKNGFSLRRTFLHFLPLSQTPKYSSSFYLFLIFNYFSAHFNCSSFPFLRHRCRFPVTRHCFPKARIRGRRGFRQWPRRKYPSQELDLTSRLTIWLIRNCLI